MLTKASFNLLDLGLSRDRIGTYIFFEYPIGLTNKLYIRIRAYYAVNAFLRIS